MRLAVHFMTTAAYRAAAITLLCAIPFATVGAAEGISNHAKASQLMTQAVQARALWDDSFPGFTADIRINYEGQVRRGEVRVTPNGEVQLRQRSKSRGPAFAWANGWLGMMVFHRLGGEEGEDQYQDVRAVGHPNHPLGVMLALDDQFDSSFRVDDKVIRQVNRDLAPGQAGGGLTRVRINVLNTRETPEGEILPLDFVINYLDDEQRLAMVETLSSDFVRLDGYDLPRWCRVITTQDGQMIAGVLELSNHRLNE